MIDLDWTPWGGTSRHTLRFKVRLKAPLLSSSLPSPIKYSFTNLDLFILMSVVIVEGINYLRVVCDTSMWGTKSRSWANMGTTHNNIPMVGWRWLWCCSNLFKWQCFEWIGSDLDKSDRISSGERPIPCAEVRNVRPSFMSLIDEVRECPHICFYLRVEHVLDCVCRRNILKISLRCFSTTEPIDEMNAELYLCCGGYKFA